MGVSLAWLEWHVCSPLTWQRPASRTSRMDAAFTPACAYGGISLAATPSACSGINHVCFHCPGIQPKINVPMKIFFPVALQVWLPYQDYSLRGIFWHVQRYVFWGRAHNNTHNYNKVQYNSTYYPLDVTILAQSILYGSSLWCNIIEKPLYGGGVLK